MDVPQSAGLVIRPIEMADAEAWARYEVLPEVKEFTSSTTSSVSDVEAHIRRVLAREAASPVHFAVTRPSGTELIATVGFHTISALNRTAEVTYDVAPSHWGQGIASAICRAACSWGFQVRGWHRIQATTVPAHQRSQRVLLRCGFKQEGVVRNFRIIKGRPADYLLYSVIPGELASEA